MEYHFAGLLPQSPRRPYSTVAIGYMAVPSFAMQLDRRAFARNCRSQYSIYLLILIASQFCSSGNGLCFRSAMSITLIRSPDSQIPESQVEAYVSFKMLIQQNTKGPMLPSPPRQTTNFQGFIYTHIGARLLALGGLSAAACRPGAGAAVGLDVSALHGVRHCC